MLVLPSILTFLVVSGSAVTSTVVRLVDQEKNEHQDRQTSRGVLPPTIEHVGTEMEPMSSYRSFCNATQPIALPFSLAGGRISRDLVARQTCVDPGYELCVGYNSCCPAGGVCCIYEDELAVGKWSFGLHFCV
jgi:hypothetical protein